MPMATINGGVLLLEKLQHFLSNRKNNFHFWCDKNLPIFENHDYVWLSACSLQNCLFSHNIPMKKM